MDTAGLTCKKKNQLQEISRLPNYCNWNQGKLDNEIEYQIAEVGPHSNELKNGVLMLFLLGTSVEYKPMTQCTTETLKGSIKPLWLISFRRKDMPKYHLMNHLGNLQHNCFSDSYMWTFTGIAN